MKSKKTSPKASYAAFTVVLEDLRAQFAVFGEALQEKASRTELYEVRDSLRSEMHGMRDELRAEMQDMREEVRAALLDLSRRLPG